MAGILPNFNKDGVLPPGSHPLTLAQIESSHLVRGDGRAGWDVLWRGHLVQNLGILVEHLWKIGIDQIFIDGSFVESKGRPNDIDGYFECDIRRYLSGELESELNQLDPKKSWTWDHAARRTYRGYRKRQLPMWHEYRVEMYPNFEGAVAGRDAEGRPLDFPGFFKLGRGPGGLKGIVQVVKEIIDDPDGG